MQVLFSPPDITEEEIQSVAEVLRSGWITTGPRTKQFERDIAVYCGTEEAACLNSATACMEMTLRVMGIGAGDEVITTAYTYTATCSCIYHAGATPVLVDTLPGSYEMDPEQVRRAINEKTKAIICVDLAGILYSHYDELYRIAEEKKHLFRPKGARQEKLGRVLIMADAAHAFGAERGGKKCGTIADFTCFSFHAVKNLTTGEGGAVTWKLPFTDPDIYRDFMLLSLHGQSKDALAKTSLGAWEYDIIEPYYKCNMTDIMAAIGSVQLKRYEEILRRRKEIISSYDSVLSKLDVTLLEHYEKDSQSSGHLYMVHVKDRDRKTVNQVIEKMAGMGVATNVHYKPLPLLSAYSSRGFAIEDYPNAYAMFRGEITLPLHTCLTDEQIIYTVDCFKKLMEEI